MSFLGWLQLLLIALKITGYITASWWLVLLPLIIATVLAILTICVVGNEKSYSLSKSIKIGTKNKKK